MKKDKDEMRSDYKRSDFTKLERGKFYAEVAAGTSVALLSQQSPKEFLHVKNQSIKPPSPYSF